MHPGSVIGSGSFGAGKNSLKTYKYFPCAASDMVLYPTVSKHPTAPQEFICGICLFTAQEKIHQRNSGKSALLSYV